MRSGIAMCQFRRIFLPLMKICNVLLLAVPMRFFCFGSLVVLDVVCGYLLFFSLDIKIGTRFK